MARLVTTGAELGSTGAENWSTGGTITIDTGTVRTGARSFKADSAAAANETMIRPLGITQALTTTYYLRAYIRLPDNTPAGVVSALMRVASAASNHGRIQLNNNGTLTLHRNATGFASSQIGSASTALVANTWHRIELGWRVASGSGDDYLEGVLDGVSFASSSATNLGTAAMSQIKIGVGGLEDTDPPTETNFVVYMDDIAINDSSGGSQTTFPGDGNVALLFPTADSARGSGWVGGAGGTTSLFDAVNNTPPVGVADTGTNASQIRNATAAANSNMDFTMTTYTAAGLGSSDTVNVVDPVVWTAAPVTTSAKQGTVGVVSNPAITNVALAAGGTAGAFWSGTAGGTFISGWKVSHGTVTYAPSVTMGTAPVMRVTQVTSSTRIAMVCSVGMYVDYTPAAAGGDVFAPYVGGGYYP